MISLPIFNKLMKKIITSIVAILITAVHTAAQSQYASRVIDFMPAPSQFTNENIASSGAAENVLGSEGAMISLGGFGGYVIFGFDRPIVNDPHNPYGVDFSIRGNSFAGDLYGVWVEPAAVQVMKDVNNNGVPDDGEWYELAGSDYYLQTTQKDVRMTYYNPHYDIRYTVPWCTNYGETGALLSNRYHSHSYYPDTFDFGCNKDSITYTGNRIRGSWDMSAPSYVESYRAPAFGYCDSRGNSRNLTKPQNPYYEDSLAVADGFDINWAVDSQGNHVILDQIDFVRIYTAGFANGGWVGEWSTEVIGVGITAPDPNYTPQDYYLHYIGITQLKVLKGETCRFEGLLFKNGIPQSEGTPQWRVSDSRVATVDNTGLFTAHDNGKTWLYFKQKEGVPEDSISVLVVELQGVILEMEGNSNLSTDTTSLIIGETIYITAQGEDNIGDVLNGNAANRFTYDSYTWTVSNPEIGTINNGLFTGKQAGQTMVYAVSVANPALMDSILVIVNEIPEVLPVGNPIAIPYYATVDTLKSNELLATGTGSTTYLNTVASKNNRITPRIDRNMLVYSITADNYGYDTLTFNITSYGIQQDIDLAFLYAPDIFPTPKQLLFLDELATGSGRTQSLKAWNTASQETKTLLTQDSGAIRDIAIDGAFVFLAAKDYTGRYNISTGEFTHKREHAEADKLAVYNNLLITAGHDMITIYNKTDLSIVKQMAAQDTTIELFLPPSDTVYDAGTYYIADGQNGAIRICNQQFAELGSIPNVELSPRTLKISQELTANEAPKASLGSMPSPMIYESSHSTSPANITVNKAAFADREDNFTLYVRDISQHASWLSIDPSYDAGKGLRLKALYEDNHDSTVTITVEAIDNYGQSALRTFAVSFIPRIYKPIVNRTIADLETTVNSQDTEIPLSGIFTHTKSNNVTFAISITNTNAEILQTTLSGDSLLILSFTPAQTGESTITLRGTAEYKNNQYPAKYAETSFRVTVTEPTGIPEIATTAVAAFPNPFADNLVIIAGESCAAIFCDLSGRQILTIPLRAGKNQIHTTALVKSVYLLKAGKTVIKLVKK
jgi:hypothetical protein